MTRPSAASCYRLSQMLHSRLINFPGKARWDQHAHAPTAHPSVRPLSLSLSRLSVYSNMASRIQAPDSIKSNYADFQSKQARDPPAPSPSSPSVSTTKSTGLPPVDAQEWWDLPLRFQRRHILEEEEMVLVEVRAFLLSLYYCTLILLCRRAVRGVR